MTTPFTPHVPNADKYLVGTIDAGLSWASGPNVGTDSSGGEVHLNYLCAIKVANDSGAPLWIRMQARRADGTPNGSPVEARIGVAGAGEDAWGQYLFVANNDRSVDLAWGVGDEQCPPSPYPNQRTLSLANRASMVRITEGGAIHGPTDAGALYVTRTTDANGQSHEHVHGRNRAATSYYLHFDGAAAGFELPAMTGGSPVIVPVEIPAGAQTVTVNASPTTGLGGETLTIVRCSDAATSLFPTTSGTVMSVPYALTPQRVTGTAGDRYVVEVTLDAGVREQVVEAWPLGRKAEKQSLTPGVPSQFEFSDEDERWEVHWDTGGDPKVIVKRTGQPPTRDC